MSDMSVQEQSVEPPPRQPDSILSGPDGLRAGWSCLLFLAIVALLSVLENELVASLHLLPKVAHSEPHVLTPQQTGLGDALSLIPFLLAAWMMSRLERRPFQQYGLSGRLALRDLAVGLLWGVTFLSGLVLALVRMHALSFDGVVLHGALAARYAVEWAVSFLVVAVFEEFVFRGYLQVTLARGLTGMIRWMSPKAAYARALGFWIAAFVLSVLLFAGLHTGNSGETAAGIAAVAAAGVTLVYSLWRTGSLWWAIGFHAAWDWAQSCLYGTADSGAPAAGHLLATHPLGSALLSGGADGPEGSLLVLPTLALVCVVIYVTLPRHAGLVAPDGPVPSASQA